MNRDDIIRMAREAGFEDFDRWCQHYPQETQRWCERMERFAAFVAAAEREACAKVCEDLDFSDWRDRGWDQGTYDCAEAIRARGQA